VNFLFFVGVIGTGVVIGHPAYLLAGIVAGVIYYLLLNGAKGMKMILGLLPLYIFLTAINPLLNTYGATPLFYLLGRPYALEALLYGGTVAGMFVAMLIWFGCYNKVLTSDKFTSLFGNLIPSISLLLVMVLRMAPNFIRKAQQITGARKSIGKGTQKLQEGMTVLGALTSWTLEGSVITGDSMRARGYGSAKRSSFVIYRMTVLDRLLVVIMAALMAFTILAASLGQMSAIFTPALDIAPVSWGVIPYTAYLLIPVALHIKEAISWHISRSRI
jgi:energy-coupling factor transport system permease protein